MDDKEYFLNAVDMADKEGYSLSHEGLGLMFSIMEHLINGGLISNFQSMRKDEAIVLLASGWITARDAVVLYSEMEEEGE